MRYLALPRVKIMSMLLITAAAIGFFAVTSPRPVEAVSPNIVISQIYGGGGNAGAPFTNDFIELFNRGTTAVDVTGWSVQYNSGTGTGAFQVTPICPTGPCLIQPGQYFLVQEGGGVNGVPLPTPNASGTIAMSATTGRVAVVNSTTPIPTGATCATQLASVDFVGYGNSGSPNFTPPICFEGAAPAPAPSNTTSDQRMGGGCQDTDQNSADFFVAAPTPRNSASPTNTCNAANSAPVRNKRADFDGDNRTDVSVWRPSDHNWYILQSGSNNSLRTVVDWGNGDLGDTAVPGDYDRDNKTDTAVYRPSEANWYIIRSSTNTPVVVNWGAPGDIPVPGDYDGDGQTDVAVWRPSTGTWHIIGSLSGVQTRAWGINGDIPVPHFDADGDAKADLVVVRISNGNAVWYIRASNGIPSTTTVAWGNSGDYLVPADYDGDNRTDIAVFRTSEGNWYIRNSTGGVTVTNWGGSSDTVVPGDYDGDGRYDVAVWRASEGNWYIRNSGNGSPFVTVFNLGTTGDVAVPYAYLPPLPVP
ncbi:MAG TPA: FG-GAP-like repeat-containing protein [Pyrinomonadaceae bacterium]|jgi:hypothetical protein